MWLLSTDRAELHFFTAPEDVRDGYAILSHVWNKSEQSFKELRELEERCAITGDIPRNFAGDKIRRCCELAERHGYKWVWIDTCCIDKSSSAELSEAINSMYRYYSLSSICYAYLEDLTPGTALELSPETERPRPSDSFGRSRWHTRGWTLQELIASPFVVFLARGWEVLGSKADSEFAAALGHRTRIPESLLKHEQALCDFSIAQRMSWAAQRVTTRVEDEAYCLLGIFDIHMPTLYGEGRRAFRRLQEEIMKRSEDTTLFAWGVVTPIVAGTRLDIVGNTVLTSSLFASSPAAFWPGETPCNYSECTGIKFDRYIVEGRPSMTGHRTTLSIHPRGVLAHIPLLATQSAVFADLSWRCSLGHRQFLVLSPCLVQEDGYPAYNIGREHYSDLIRRAVLIHANEYNSLFYGKPRIHPNTRFTSSYHAEPVWQWKDVYLLHEPSAAASLPVLPMNGLLSPPQRFHFPALSIQAFLDQLNGTASGEDLQAPFKSPESLRYTLTSATNVGLADMDVPTTFVFFYPRVHSIVIQVGRFKVPHGLLRLWARVLLVAHAQLEETLHNNRYDWFTDCVARWPLHTKDFTFDHPCHKLLLFSSPSLWGSLVVRLSFPPSPLSPTSRVLHASAHWLHE